MARNSGSRTTRCPICEQPYKLTNFMKRDESNSQEVKQVTVWGKTFRLRDTHMIACYKKYLKAQELQP